MSNNITKLNEKKISKAKEKLDALRKIHKSTHSSVYNGIERILKEYKILLAAYHGGDFNNVNIITLMQKLVIYHKLGSSLAAKSMTYWDLQYCSTCEAAPPFIWPSPPAR
jgi:hypothetical protein